MKHFLFLLIVSGMLITTAHAMTWEDYQARKDDATLNFILQE